MSHDPPPRATSATPPSPAPVTLGSERAADPVVELTRRLGHAFRDPRLFIASLDHTVWFHRPFRADHWWLYDQSSPSASGGRGLALAQVFSESGELVATVAQEGLIRRLA